MVNITIIGVVGDSRFRSVRTPIDPIMFQIVKKRSRGPIPSTRLDTSNRAGRGWLVKTTTSSWIREAGVQMDRHPLYDAPILKVKEKGDAGA